MIVDFGGKKTNKWSLVLGQRIGDYRGKGNGLV